MVQVSAQLSTGLPGLDKALRGLIPGDNLVWQVDAVDGYAPFVERYCRSTLSQGRRLVYFRFADHRPLVVNQRGVDVHRLDPRAGFEAFTSSPWLPIEADRTRQGIWHRTFAEAEEFLHAERCFTTDDLLGIGRRIIGTGRIGGKAIGMLLARNILQRGDPQWANVLEAHDSFYVGSDVFYTFLVENGLWEKGRTSHDPDHYLDGIDRARQHITVGSFPDHTRAQFQRMLGYFGQSRLCPVDRIVYVVPAAYSQLPMSDRYAVARLIGRITHLPVGSAPMQPWMLHRVASCGGSWAHSGHIRVAVLPRSRSADELR